MPGTTRTRSPGSASRYESAGPWRPRWPEYREAGIAYTPRESAASAPAADDPAPAIRWRRGRGPAGGPAVFDSARLPPSRGPRLASQQEISDTPSPAADL